MKQSLMNINEQTMNWIETYQVHNNASQFMKLSLMNFHELATNRIKIYQVHNNSPKFINCLSWTFIDKLWTELITPS